MRGKVVAVVLCSLALSECFAKKLNVTVVRKIKDNQSEESVNQFLSIFKETPVAVYASAIPHGAPSFHAPQYLTHERTDGHITPARHDHLVLHKPTPYLTDSYGNKYAGNLPPSFKPSQQYVSLQDLPAHLAQPLVAASPRFHFQQNVPQYSYGSSVRLPNQQIVRASPPKQFVQYGSTQKLSPLAFTNQAAVPPPQQNRFTNIATHTNVALQPSNQNVIYSNINPYGRPRVLQPEPKYQRLEQGPQVAHFNNVASVQNPNIISRNEALLKSKPNFNIPQNQVQVTTLNSGKETVIDIPTKPPVPYLLDYSLLEPLLFKNPVVPQVQHYLPRISFATYKKLPQANDKSKEHVVIQQKTISYSNAKQPNVLQNSHPEQGYIYNDSNEDKDAPRKQPPSHFKPLVTQAENSHNTEGLQYNIHNVVTEQNQREREPNYYIVVKDEKSNEDQEITPKAINRPNHSNENHHYEDSNSDYYPKEGKQNSNSHSKNLDSTEYNPSSKQQYQDYQYNEQPRKSSSPNNDYPSKQEKAKTPKKPYKPYNNSKHLKLNVHNYQKQDHRQHNIHPTAITNTNNSPEHTVIKDETPVDTYNLKEQILGEMIREEENNEDDFEKSYKNAAYGFPAYNEDNNEKANYYDQVSYGEPQSDAFQDFPFKLTYQESDESNEEPKNSPLVYQDLRDHNTKQYYTDLVSRQPKEFKELEQLKDNYFRTYQQHVPSEYYSKSDKSTPESMFNYHPSTKKKEKGNQRAQYKVDPVDYGYDYSGEKTGNSANDYAQHLAPNPSSRNKLAITQFVEPQFQYGFEPIARLLDSELAAMASNNNAEGESPGIMKKIYKENWFIHKLSTEGGNPNS